MEREKVYILAVAKSGKKELFVSGYVVQRRGRREEGVKVADQDIYSESFKKKKENEKAYGLYKGGRKELGDYCGV